MNQKNHSLDKAWITAITFLLLTVFTLPVFAVDIYVATNGNDNTGNGSASNPYKTIRKAASAATAGTTVLVGAGTYVEESIKPNVSGTADAMIVFKPAPGAEGLVIIKHNDIFTGSTITPAVKSNWLAQTGWTAAQTTHYTDADIEYSIAGYLNNKLTDVFDLYNRNYIRIEGFIFRDYKYARSTIDIQGTGNAVINCQFINLGTVHAAKWWWLSDGVVRGDCTLPISGSFNVIRNNYFQSVYGEILSYAGGSNNNLITENTIINAIGKNDTYTGANSSTLGGRFSGNQNNAFTFNYNGGTTNGPTIWLDICVIDFLALRNVSHNVDYFIRDESGCERNWIYENIAYNLPLDANKRMQGVPAGQFADFPAQQINDWPAYHTAFWDTGSTWDTRWVNNVAYNVKEGIDLERSWRDEVRNNIVFEDRNSQVSNGSSGFKATETSIIGFHPWHGLDLKGGVPKIIRNNLWFSNIKQNFVRWMDPSQQATTVANLRAQIDAPYELGTDPMFENPAAGDFRLKPGSPAIGSGDNGVDRGAFAIYPQTPVGFNQYLGLLDDVNVSFSTQNTSVRSGTVSLELKLTQPATRTMTFEVFPIAGDARLDLDFRFPNGQTVTFNPGDRTKTVRVEILPGNPQHNLDQLLALSIRPVGSTRLEEVGPRNQHFIKIRRVTKYSITMNDVGDSIAHSIVEFYKPGETVTVDAKTRPGYTFGGWQAGYHDILAPLANPNSARTTFVMPAYNLTIRALWNPIGTPPPYVAVTGVTLNRTSLSFSAAGLTSPLTATVQPSNSTIQYVFWTSSNPLVATVDQNGVVTAVSYGTATIFAKAVDKDKQLTAQCSVAVTGGKVGINLSSTTAYTFPSAEVGYGTQAPLSSTVSNSGAAATGLIMVTLSGTDASSFLLRRAGGGDEDWKIIILSLDSIAAGSTTTRGFEVRPADGLAEGTYNATVTVSAVGAAQKSFDVTFTVTSANGIIQVCSASTIFVYPNPTTGELKIKNEELGMGDIEIFDANGRLVGVYPCGRPVTTINISHLVEGIYFLKINGETVKIIKK